MELTLPAEAASATIKSEFAARRAALKEVQLRNPNGKMAKRAGVLMLDMDAFEDRVLECGGDEGFLYFLTAQVMSGVTLRDICDHYLIEPGLIGAWLLAEPERMAKYNAAQRWLADGHVMEMVPISDAATPESLEIDKHRTKVRREVAGLLHKERFGSGKDGLAGNGQSNVIDAALTFAAAELLGRIQRPAEKVVSEQ